MDITPCWTCPKHARTLHHVFCQMGGNDIIDWRLVNMESPPANCIKKLEHGILQALAVKEKTGAGED